jgi:hypothetical protein
MADLNALIAQGYQPQAQIDPFAQYAKMQQLNVGQNQNALAQYQLAQAQRADVQANALNAAYAGGVNPDTGEMDYAKVRRYLGAAGAGSQIPALEKTRLDQQEAALKQKKLVGEIAAQPVALAKATTDAVDAQLKQSKERLNLINPTAPDVREQLLAWHQSNHQGLLGDTLRASGSTPEQTQGAIEAAVAKGPAGIADFIQRSTLGQTEFEKSIAPVPEAVTDGKTKFFVDKNPRSPTFGKKIGGEGFAMGMTPGETSTAGTAAASLTFQKQKFDWEKANPGHDLVQGEGGEYFAVDKKTRAMTPLMVGGAAPAAAAPMGGGQGARGVVGVTDGGRAAPTAGVPFVGKTSGLTESQSNAALFGSGMAQAQNVLTQASKKGVDTAPVTTSIVQGIVKYVPFGVGDKLVQDVMSVAQQDPTKLFGPDVEQQKVGQAQLAFTIAYLRKTSGAAFGQSELVNTMNEFFPSVGEDKAVTTQKAKARERVVEGMKLGAGSQGAKFIKQYQGEDTGGVAPSANDPLGLRK